MKSVFSRKLSRLRREAGCSQRQAASDLGISQALLSHYENGAREPKLEFVTRVCDYYNVSADHLLGRTEEKMRSALPAPHGCESAQRLVVAAGEVFETLDRHSDKELYPAVMDYLVIPIENVAMLLRDPGTRYDPIRDADMKMAEARFVSKIRDMETI